MSNKNLNRRNKVSSKRMQLPKADFRFLTVHTRYKQSGRTFVQVPEIVLKGDWLAALGFQCGELVQLAPDGQGLQIIRVVPAPDVGKYAAPKP